MFHKLFTKQISTILKSDIVCAFVMSVLKIHFLITNSEYALFPHLTIKILYRRSITNDTFYLFVTGILLEFSMNYMLTGTRGYSKYCVIKNKIVTFILFILIETIQSIYLFDHFIITGWIDIKKIFTCFIFRKIPVCVFLYIRSIHNRVVYDTKKQRRITRIN